MNVSDHTTEFTLDINEVIQEIYNVQMYRMNTQKILQTFPIFSNPLLILKWLQYVEFQSYLVALLKSHVNQST